MRLRIAVVLAVAVTAWVGWGVFIYRPAPNALPPCSPNGELACSTVDGFPLGTLIQDCGGQPDACGDHAQLAFSGLLFRPQSDVIGSAEYGLDMARFCGPVICSISGYSIFVFAFAGRVPSRDRRRLPRGQPCLPGRPDVHGELLGRTAVCRWAGSAIRPSTSGFDECWRIVDNSCGFRQRTLNFVDKPVSQTARSDVL